MGFFSPASTARCALRRVSRTLRPSRVAAARRRRAAPSTSRSRWPVPPSARRACPRGCVDFLAHEFASLRGRRLAFALRAGLARWSSLGHGEPPWAAVNQRPYHQGRAIGVPPGGQAQGSIRMPRCALRSRSYAGCPRWPVRGALPLDAASGFTNRGRAPAPERHVRLRTAAASTAGASGNCTRTSKNLTLLNVAGAVNGIGNELPNVINGNGFNNGLWGADGQRHAQRRAAATHQRRERQRRARQVPAATTGCRAALVTTCSPAAAAPTRSGVAWVRTDFKSHAAVVRMPMRSSTSAMSTIRSGCSTRSKRARRVKSFRHQGVGIRRRQCRGSAARRRPSGAKASTATERS